MEMNDGRKQVGFFVDQRDLDIIDKAAELQKRSRSTFFVMAALNEAKKEIQQEE